MVSSNPRWLAGSQEYVRGNLGTDLPYLTVLVQKSIWLSCMAEPGCAIVPLRTNHDYIQNIHFPGLTSVKISQHTFCILDMPGLPCPNWVTGSTVYLRYHGFGLVYGGQYGRKALQPWVDHIQCWLAEGRKVHACFNNDAFGYALEDAHTLRDLLDV